MSNFNVDISYLEFIKKGCYNVVYKYKNYVFKYCNNPRSLEHEILSYLNDKGLNIPKIVHISYNITTNYKYLIIMDYISGENNNFKTLSLKKNILLQLIDIISSLHSHGIIYGDTLSDNFIVTKDDKVFLIDFDKSFYKDNVPTHFSQKIKERPITTDIFALELLMVDLLRGYTIRDLLELSDLRKVVEYY